MMKKVKKSMTEFFPICLLSVALFMSGCDLLDNEDSKENYYDPFDDPYDPDDENNIPSSLPIQRISLSITGAEGNWDSFYPVPNRDGRYFAFYSKASNLIKNDTNRVMDLFVYDRQNNTLLCISRANSSSQGNGQNFNPAISADGSLIAFQSHSRNIVPGYTNTFYQIIVYNRVLKRCERISGRTEAAQGNNDSYKPAISTDSQYVAFESDASNLVASDLNAQRDIFVFDRKTNTLERVSLGSGGVEANGSSYEVSISGDGRFVAFDSLASNLVPGDTNNKTDVFLVERGPDTRTIERISVSSNGEEGNDHSLLSSISDDGRYIVFESAASNLVPADNNGNKDVFLYDRVTKTQKRISVGNNGAEANNESTTAFISGDGRYVTFQSMASNLVAGDTNNKMDVFVYDRHQNSIRLVSRSAAQEQGDNTSANATITPDGRYVVFHSSAGNLVDGDTNGFFDIFVAPNE